MTERAVDLGTLPVEPRKTAADVLKAVPAAPATCLIAFVVAATIVFTPDLRIDGWRWILVGLGIAAATLLAWPLHRSTVTALANGRFGAEVLGSLTVVVSALAATDTVLRDHQTSTSLAAIAVAFLTVTAVWIRGDTSFVQSPAWFTAVVVSAAAVATIAWWLARDADAARDTATAMLIASGPGTLLLAGPLALITTRRGLRDHGIVLSDPSAVLASEDIDTVVLDKHGTITTGELTVVAVDPVEPDHDRNLRWFAGALEHASDHRIGRAISSLSGRGRLAQVEHVPGQGLSGAVDRHPVRVGEPSWLGMDVAEGLWTTVGVEVDARALGTITVADDVRPDASDGVMLFQNAGVEVVLASREATDRANDLAGRTGIARFHGDLDEAAEHQLVADLAAQGRAVASAGFTTTHARVDLDDLGVADRSVARLAQAVTSARRAVVHARRARRLAVLLGVLGIALGATGLLAPWVAAAVSGAGLVATAAVSTVGAGH